MKKVKTSLLFNTVDLLDIYEYGEAAFGQKLALNFIEDIYYYVEKLETEY